MLADEGRAEEIERVKQQQLKEQKEGKNTWKEDIASDSESVVSERSERSERKAEQYEWEADRFC